MTCPNPYMYADVMTDTCAQNTPINRNIPYSYAYLNKFCHLLATHSLEDKGTWSSLSHCGTDGNTLKGLPRIHWYLQTKLLYSPMHQCTWQ